MSILVVGGAGYIGSHAVAKLINQGYEVIVIDNLVTGHRAALDPKAKFYPFDIRDKEAVQKVFREYDFEAVFHFAANSLVGESVEIPLTYFNNNVYGMQILLEIMVEFGVDKLIFSSSAAVYGDVQADLITEDTLPNPSSPYGESKLIMEKMIKWCSEAYDIRYVSLRYFNVAGAKVDGQIGEDHRPETHLVPIVLQVPLGQREKLIIFGDDYPTADGTCVRDYVHVEDLIDAHILAFKYLQENDNSQIINLGSSQGFSVKQVWQAACHVTGKNIPYEMGRRRVGDPAKLVAESSKAREVLGWQPQFDSIDRIIQTAWDWHLKYPEGYKDR